MTDMTATIIPKSDQMNSDDLISGPRVLKIVKVSADTSSPEQPILVHYEGDDGKPYKPCKSMRRVMVAVWGADGASFVGRSLRVYRDPSVKWGGLEVGGIRISHMSDMDGPMTMALTATKQSRKPYTVKPLEDAPKGKTPAAEYATEARAKIDGATDFKQLSEWWSETEAKRNASGIPQDKLDAMNKAVGEKLEKLAAA